MKKLLVLMGLCCIPLISSAGETATNLLILNNSNSQQFPDIWSRMRAGFKMQHQQTDRVKYFEQLYTKNPKNFNRLMANAIPYLYFMLTEIERRGLPAELALIPGVESSYDPLAKNSLDAYAGMWQFVPSTGRQFNMIQNDNLDERRDIVKSTRAALNYFAYLNLMFHQWDVAIGAYNWGEGGMYRAVLNSGMPLGKVKYSELELRQITADYVPKIIALASIIDNPHKFGVSLDSTPNQPYFAIVSPASNTTVADISRLSGTDKQVFSKLNAEYKVNTYTLTPENNILLPQDNQNTYYANIGQAVVIANNVQLANNSASGDANLKPAAFVVVASAESNVPESGVNESNETGDLSQKSQQLDNLLAQIDSSKQQEATNMDNSRGEPDVQPKVNVVKYQVNSGDTLYSIAKKFNVNVDKIRTDNHIPGNNLILGQVLTIETASN